MAMQNPYGKYKQEAILNASKEEITLMLYDGAIKFCNQAIIAIDAKDIVKAHDMIVRVENIIEEFMITLNRKYEVSDGLYAIYDYLMYRLTDANIKKDKEILEDTLQVLRGLRDTWKQAMLLAKQAQ